MSEPLPDSGSDTPPSSQPTIIGASTDAAAPVQSSLPLIEGYVIGRCLGQGGMGAVYEGVQESTGRRVAIKVMLDSAMASDAGRKRFEREVEVVARLDHPGIVAVIDSGVRRGRYFYAMEFVEGRALDEAVTPGTGDPRIALAVLAEVCDAVDYAHQRAVLHRDLKPANIIVDARGRARLLDFGIAQVLGPASARETVSRPGQLIGTVAYMAPEQASGSAAELGVRTDVYALGAIGYELLTGRLPCEVDGPLVDVLRAISEKDPPRPSVHRPGIGRDVDAVLLKALEKHADRRYPTAGDMAADIRRYLEGRPVVARPVGPVGRSWRWAKRNKALAAVVIVSVATLAGVSTALVLRIVQERDRAVQNFSLLKRVLESADPEARDGGVTIPALMDSAVTSVEKLPPSNAASEADIREIIGGVYRKFALYEKAAVNQRKVLDIRRRAAHGDDPQVAEAMHNLAATLWWDGKYTEAEPLYEGALKMRQRLFKRDDPAIAFSMTHLATCRLSLGRIESARSMFQGALDMRTRIYGPEHEQVAASLNNLAKCEMDAEEFPHAEALLRAALAMIVKVKGENHPGTAATSSNLADCLIRRAELDRLEGREPAALAQADEAVHLYQHSFDIRSGMYREGHNLIASNLAGLARASLFLHRQREADGYAEQSLDMMLKKRRPDHPDVMEVLAVVGDVALGRGDASAARGYYQRAVEIAIHAQPMPPVRLAELHVALGEATALAGDRDSAEPLLQEGLDVMRSIKSEGSLLFRLAQARASRARDVTRPRGP